MAKQWVPFENKVELPAHRKLASCLAFNPKANRMATGGYDSIVKLWDFQGLTKALKSFKEFEPLPHHSIKAISYNQSGSHVLVAPGGNNCRLYDMNGEFILQSVGGDVYIKDQTKTNGHTGTITGCCWDPEKKDIFYTCAIDGTIRAWDITARTIGLDKDIECVGVWRVLDNRNALSKACQPTCMTALPMLSVTQKQLAVGCSDGSIQVINVSKKGGIKPDITIRKANKQGVHDGEICSIFASNSTELGSARIMFTRGMDSTIQAWDVANIKAPLFVVNCDTEHDTANACVSPCGRLLLAPTCVVAKDKGKDENGAIQFKGEIKVWDLSLIRDNGGEESFSLPLPSAGGIQIEWPAEIDQLFVSLTTGKVLGCYEEVPVESQTDAKRGSKKGLLLSINVEAKREEEGSIAIGEIWTEADWESQGFREGRDGDLRLKREFRQKKFARNVETPGDLSSKWGAGGALATGGTLTDYLVGSLAQNDIRSGQEDAQKALQAYAKKMEDEGIESTMIGTAYKRTQPDNVLDRTTWDDLDEVSRTLQLKQKCPACGLKMCTCPPGMQAQNKKFKYTDWN